MITEFIQALTSVTPLMIVLIFVGVAIGIVFGSIPGLTATMAIVMFLPMTYTMNPANAMSLLMALYIGDDTSMNTTPQQLLDRFSDINYLVAIRKLTESLRLAQFFDFPTLKRIATNNNNLDSLLILSTMSYYNMDSYLRESNRADVSAMMVTGVWTESLYLASQVYKKKENKRMRDHIASQKNILDDLMTVLVHYMGNNVDNVKLVSAFKELSKAYEPVSIEVIDGEDKVEMLDGQTVTTQGSYTVITVSDEQMTQIVKAVETLRKKITEAL